MYLRSITYLKGLDILFLEIHHEQVVCSSVNLLAFAHLCPRASPFTGTDTGLGSYPLGVLQRHLQHKTEL